MTNQRSILFLLLGAAVMVAAVVGALFVAGRMAGSDDGVPAVAMNRGDIEKIVRNYILENPNILIEALEGMKAEEGEQRVAKLREKAKIHANELYNEPEPLFVGNPKGDVTVVEFFDYRCQFCRKARQALTDLMKQDGGVRVVFKEYPILSKESELAAKAAIASLPQGKYWDFHVALMDAEDLSEKSIFVIAKSVGLDVEKLRAEMKNPKTDARVVDTEKLGRELGVDATPTFFIGTEAFTGALTLQELKEAVAAARKARAG
jgi:protein-disulfide isomerase